MLLSVSTWFRGQIAPYLTSIKQSVASQVSTLTTAVNAANAKGLPTGGVPGQMLSKSGGVDFQSQWVTPTTAAAGAATSIQFNNNSVVSGDTAFTWDNVSKTLTLGGSNTSTQLQTVTAQPTPPVQGVIRLYAGYKSGRAAPVAQAFDDMAYALQAANWERLIYTWGSTNATAGFWSGTAGAGAGTFSRALPTTTSRYTAVARGRWANVATTANQVLGQRNTEAMFFRGSVAGQGGFFFQARGGFDTWTNGARFFVGMHTATTVITANPSLLANTVGFCVDSTDNGDISFLTRNATAATKAATGLTISSGKGYTFFIFCAPNSSQYSWEIVDINTGTKATGIATSTLPVNTTLMTAGFLASNAALTAASAVNVGCSRIYIETV